MSTETARIFNSAIEAAAISATFELGVFDELHDKKRLVVADFCFRRDLHESSLTALLEVLHRSRIVQLDSGAGTAAPGPLFGEAFADKGYFLWLVRGYGTMLEGLSGMVRNENRNGDFIQRNGRYIAMAGRDYGGKFVDPHFNPMLDEVPFAVAADIGCGSAERLIHLARSRPGFRGVGVDVNEYGVGVARDSVRQAGLEDRISLLHGDVQSLEPHPNLADVELVFCFFMGHDLWPRESCLQTLNRIRELFPRAQRFLLADTYRSDVPLSGDVPIFTLGFEVTHALMGQYIPTVPEWLDLFVESNWTCVGQREIGIPYSTIFDLRRG